MEQHYYSIKFITAWRSDKSGNDGEGYAIRYPDGYISWAPKKVFEESSQPTTAMSFGRAVHAIMEGKKIRRSNMDWEECWVQKAGHPSDSMVKPHLQLLHQSGDIRLFIPSSEDMFAEDWMLVSVG